MVISVIRYRNTCNEAHGGNMIRIIRIMRLISLRREPTHEKIRGSEKIKRATFKVRKSLCLREWQNYNFRS